MDPTASANRPPRDVSDPVPNPLSSSPVSTDGLASRVVDNIPVKTQASPPASKAPPSHPAGEDDELDKILQDVGHQLKKEDKAPPKKRRSLFGRKPKNQPEAKLLAQPLPRPAPQPQSAVPSPAAMPQAAAQSKEPKTSSTPVLVITLTIIVTGILIAAAIYSYKK